MDRTVYILMNPNQVVSNPYEVEKYQDTLQGLQWNIIQILYINLEQYENLYKEPTVESM